MIKKVFSLAKVVRSGCSFNGIISSCNSIFLFFSLVWFENKQMDRLFSFIGEISYYTSASLMQVALASKINALLWKYLFICFSFIHIFFIDVSHTHTHTHTHTHIYMRCKLGLFCEEIYQKTVYWSVCFWENGVSWLA